MQKADGFLEEGEVRYLSLQLSSQNPLPGKAVPGSTDIDLLAFEIINPLPYRSF